MTHLISMCWMVASGIRGDISFPHTYINDTKSAPLPLVVYRPNVDEWIKKSLKNTWKEKWKKKILSVELQFLGRKERENSDSMQNTCTN